MTTLPIPKRKSPAPERRAAVADSTSMEYRSANEHPTASDSHPTTSDDLENILYSIDVATLFLDTDLNIRFFTPATQSLFSFGSGDIGKPLANFHSLAADDTLLLDARTVLKTNIPIEREIKRGGDDMYNRRVLPYQHTNRGVEGVV